MLPPRTWSEPLLCAMLPHGHESGLPGLASTRLADFWVALDAHAPPLFRLGIWVAVTALTWLPLLRYGRPLHRLDTVRRDSVLARAARSRVLLLRQCAEIAKMLACLAYFDDAALRAAVLGRSA